METDKFRYEFQGLERVENVVFLNKEVFSICLLLIPHESNPFSNDIFILSLSS